ncbi:uncharacterized protein LOC130713003 [Lotus japonicus]|uniref:uncharacterized protein LOC130713003 n=1 Tax=Lotus japonicus TaxID=34305 RepID=UPI002582C5BC|nr:uncharacterized protein LOC130713003 [Lotus japonicus]
MAAQGSNATLEVPQRADPGWKFCKPYDAHDTSRCICNFCGKMTKGGITRMKEHLMAKPGNVAPCPKCPKEVRDELWAILNDKKKKDSEAYERVRLNLLDDDCLRGDSDEERAMDEGLEIATRENKNKKVLKGQIDMYLQKPESAIAKKKNEKLRQESIRASCDKESTARVHQYIARFWYQAGLSFNMVKLQSFRDMLATVGSFGPHLKPPSYHDIRVPLLAKEVDYTENLLKGQKEQWKRFGCSIMSDAWTDRKQRSIINFMVNCSAGTMFLKSVDASDYVKTGEKLFELLDSIIDEVGEENVVQVITDNGSNYVSAGKMLEEKRPNLYWTPCAAHCIDLMLEDIGKIPLIKKTIQRAISLVGFIYGHTSTLSLLRYYTKKRELVRHAVTRFATSYLTLKRLRKEKGKLREMFVSHTWTNNKLSNEPKGKQATKIVLMNSFWNSVCFILKVMGPLVRVLRLADSEKKPAMGYIYEAMDKAKEAIRASLRDDKSKYQKIWDIIDNRWNSQLHRPLHAAGHFLNPEYYYNDSELDYDFEVQKGVYDCVERLSPTDELRKKILTELPIYKSGGGMFGSKFAIEQRGTIAPAQWWRMYGQSTPNLTKLAIKILSLTCSASGCERNWSVFEQIHTKKRNKLEHKRLEDLVFVKYNQALVRRYNIRDELDPISLDDIDESNEWLVGTMEEDEDDAGNDRVFPEDDLTWDVVYKASGIGEPSTNTRRGTRKRKEVTTAAGNSSKKKKGATASKNGKEPIVIEDEEEEISDNDLEDSEIEADGYVSLSDEVDDENSREEEEDNE